MQIITDIQQGTPEWLKLRLGIITCSELDCLLVSGKGEAGFGVAAFTYMDQLIGERITEEAAEIPFQTKATTRGHELEGVAKGLYEAREGIGTDSVGIILNHGIGYSPDALVAADGLIEIKTKLPKFQVGVLLAGEVPKEHVAQCQGGLWVSEREWIDFISYWPGLPLFVKRVYRDEAMIRKLVERVKTFYEILDDRMDRVMGAAA
ncbi:MULTISPECIES: lambda exonuclease family protein [unclassified Pseudomonas]|uniref:lambda exonuclease family protein n=1 Tax=unclassified Pseudomonas TaxID=196821 RepID=UPI000BD9328A|nr:MULTISPECIES: lambda exonuclease family protein [unclassified Pseudomonas]PVZ19962.1 YqaJ-like recombinase protein [Pseudomonas sp. URIL14HWK12:I12]PVZ27028.1 YqaJ-like recombinase protein [Pseudomonas sp. URIL14HWK12:I10]PVZ37917.1 YqaJ-like recombinase protein [Pseudomonas sp. URIL14HWK12:I11]SNZ05150.1 YqaJ-like recombinase domain-containing protein [Pseudomonas sp. URIL14HWK12:I9]